MTLTGYEAVVQLAVTSGSILCSARHSATHTPVLLKLPLSRNPASAQSAALRREYELLRSLPVAGVARPVVLLESPEALAIALEPFDGESFEAVLTAGDGRFGWFDALSTARALAQVLAALHMAHVVHRDFRPVNFLMKRQSSAVCLVDLSMAAGSAAGENVTVADDAWAYVAPEQTGRMNRAVDHRADLYALGITLYRMLTGRLPFEAADALEWMHCHVARMPRPPGERVALPRVVSDMTMKLLAKSADERYQTANGLLFDIDRCLALAKIARPSSVSVDPFELGSRDVSDRLQISQRLYGRDAELSALQAAFERVRISGLSELALISGPAGSGKTVLVHELNKAVLIAHASFVAGKFDQHGRDLPYATLARALGELVKQILSESEAHIASCRERLSQALGISGQLMINLIPALELVIGKQPPVVALEPRDAESRLGHVFRRFIGTFARREHPLVIFIDDLHWADDASLDLLTSITREPSIHHLLVVGAYRDGDAQSTGQGQLLVDRLQREQTPATRIELGPLPADPLRAFIADTLHQRQEEVAPLADLVCERTGGNAFFSIQFLLELADESLLVFDRPQARWTWRLDAIGAKAYTRNVVDLMVGKLARLPLPTQQALRNAACLGNSVDTGLLAAALGRPQADTETDLAAAVRAGLLQRLSSTYTFVHDRVQEAALSLIPDAERALLHLGMGRLLLAHLAPSAVEARIFDVVHALNHGAALITDAEERKEVLRLNLIAGRKAKAATAFTSAARFFGQALALFPETAWDTQYEELFPLQLELAKCEFLSGNFERADGLLAPAFERARGRMDRVRVYRLKISLYLASGRTMDGVTVALEALSLFDLQFPSDAETADREIGSAMQDIRVLLQGRRIRDLADAPQTRNPEVRATIGLLAAALEAVYLARPMLYPLICSSIVKLSIEHGNSEASSPGYLGHANVLAAKFRDMDAASEFSELALRLDQTFGATRARGRLLFAQSALINHWRQPYSVCRRQLADAFASALELGTVFTADYSKFDLLLALEQGEPLDTIIELAARRTDLSLRYGPQLDMDLQLDSQFARCLKGLTSGPDSLDDEGFRESDCLAGLERTGSQASFFLHHVLRQTTAFLAGNHQAALGHAREAAPLVERLLGIPRAASHHLFHLLSLAALFADADESQQEQTRRAFRDKLPMFDAWATDCPQNYLSRSALARAEFARIEGRALDALQAYELAVQSARTAGLIHDEAIACELAAGFHAERGLITAGEAHLRRARACYDTWGAAAKVRQLDEQHPSLRQADDARKAPIEPDLLAIVKASQAISSQIELDDLLDTLMRIGLETAGAQKATLFLAGPDGLGLAAEGQVRAQAIEVRIPPEVASVSEAAMGELPIAVLNYVRNSREPLMIAEASLPHAFSSDPYLAQRQPKSVLCLPLLSRTDLIGVLYLEHGLVSHAFTQGRIELLGMLASQAAISLETARLYASLQEREARIRTLVDANVIGIRIADLDGRIVEANDAYLDLVGYSHADVAAGRVNTDLLTPPEYRSADSAGLQQLDATGRYGPYEKEYVRKDGSRVPILVGGTYLGGPARRRTMGFVLDLTERRDAEAEREARRVADLANRAKSEFLASMSHELRTPLNAILGYAQLLKMDTGLSNRQHKDLDTIRQGGEHLLALINDILDLSRIEAGRLELSHTSVDLQAFLGTVADIIRVEADKKNLAFILDAAAGLPRTVLVDERRLRQVLLNLLSNAVKFTDHGRVTLSAHPLPPDAPCQETRDAARSVTRIRFEVSDSGIGMSEAQLARLFQPFEQVGELKRREGGTGLGLAISRHLVRAMEGDVQVRSQPGEGSSFWFELDVRTLEHQAMATPKLGNPIGYEGPRKTLLVVDDVAQNRAMLVDLLKGLGFDLCSAADGRECLEMARATRPDLILMDLTMPVMDGCEAIRQIRLVPGLAGVPIIATSASATPTREALSRDAGANAFVPKPIEYGALLKAIGRLGKLTWIDEESRTQVPPTTGADQAQLVYPPSEDMAVLRRLAQIGNMTALRQQAEHLNERDARYAPFAARLVTLAEGFQSKAIVRFIEGDNARHGER